MNQSESQLAAEKLARLSADFGVTVVADWGTENPDGTGEWRDGSWSVAELDRLQDSLALLATLMGGNARFAENLGSVTVKKADIGSHGGEALTGQVTFSSKRSFSTWTVVHEFAHAWDANQGWRLSRELERYTGGFTFRFLSWVQKFFGLADLNGFAKADEPGKRGRKPGCNARGYFYGDKPSGADWNFNRVEDFAESVAMYVGWGKDNALHDHAHARISRYEIPNGEIDPFFQTKDEWADYKKYFYPANGDYTKTKRWKFVEELVESLLAQSFDGGR